MKCVNVNKLKHKPSSKATFFNSFNHLFIHQTSAKNFKSKSSGSESQFQFFPNSLLLCFIASPLKIGTSTSNAEILGSSPGRKWFIFNWQLGVGFRAFGSLLVDFVRRLEFNSLVDSHRKH